MTSSGLVDALTEKEDVMNEIKRWLQSRQAANSMHMMLFVACGEKGFVSKAGEGDVASKEDTSVG